MSYSYDRQIRASLRMRWKQHAAPYSMPGKPKARRTSYATGGGYEWEISPTSKMPHVGHNHDEIGRYWQVVRDGAEFGSVHKTLVGAKAWVAEWLADHPPSRASKSYDRRKTANQF